MSTAVSDKVTNRYTKIITSQLSLWDALEEETQPEDRQQDLIAALSEWAVLNGYPELPAVGIKLGRSNWPIDTWDLPRLEAVHTAADLFSQRRKAYFALSHWAIENGHPRLVVGDQVIEAGLTSWVEWEKGAPLEELHLALEEAIR